MFELLEQLGIELSWYDGVIYDVLGDVVCGGFAVPLRRDYADKVYIVTSGEFMSLYAANNILRGLLGYSTNENRAGGIILNSRGLKDEDERVRRFCEGVGLPILETFPRSDLFAQSEQRGACLVECFPQSELAGAFESLGTRIFEEADLYPANPLTDSELEEKVLGKKRAPGIQKRVDIQPAANHQKTRLYSKNLVMHEPLQGCAFSGAMSVCTQVMDAVCIAHGPDSCAHIAYQAITSLSRRFLLERGTVLMSTTAPPILSTGMSESVMIFGGKEELRAKIDEAKKSGAKLIFVLTTCPSGIIGDDISFVQEAREGGAEIIPILADGNLNGDYMQGILMAYAGIARRLIDMNRRPAEDTVNIIGEKSIAATTEESHGYIEEMLAGLGIRINCRFICDTDTEKLRGFKTAQLNLLAYDDYMCRALQSFLEKEFDAEFFDLPFPVGFDESCRWIEKIGGYFNKAQAAAQIVLDYRREYEAEIAKIKPYLKGKRLMILAYNHRIDWILQAAIDSEMEIAFVGIMEYAGDNLFLSKFTDSILEFVDPYPGEQRRETLERVRPDILLTNYSDAQVDHICFTDTIPLCPPVGFLSGVHIMKRWGEFFRMNLSEGWRSDADIYRKYSAR